MMFMVVEVCTAFVTILVIVVIQMVVCTGSYMYM